MANGIVETIADSDRPSKGQIEERTARAGQGPAIDDARAVAEMAMFHPPIGAIIIWPSDVLPQHPTTGLSDAYLWATGGLYEVELYPDLYAVYGTKWNTGLELATQFRVPDLRSRLPLGAGQGAGLTGRNLAVLLGAETHILSENQMAAHDHTGIAESMSHLHGGDTFHSFTSSNVDLVSGSSGVLRSAGTSTGNVNSAIHGHDLDVDNAGGGAAHNNMPPCITLNYILRARR